MSGSGRMSDQERYALAQQLHKQGRYAEAEGHYRAVLTATGEYDGLLVRLGEVCFCQERFEDAASFYRRAAAVAPRNTIAAGGLASALHRLGRLEEALAAYSKAIDLDPGAIDAQYGSGNCLARLGRTEEAVARFEAALERQPDHIASLYDLGTALMLLDRTEEGIACFEHILRVKPDFAPAYYGLVDGLQNMNQHEEALPRLRRLVALIPGQTRPRNLLGRSLSALGRAEEASAAFQGSLTIDENNADTHFEIGTALQLGGRFADARRAFERSIATAPNVPTYWHSLVLCEKIQAGDPVIAALEDMARRAAEFAEPGQAFIYFALAKVYDDLKRYEEAFAALTKANAVQRRLSPYDEAAELESLRIVASLFSQPYLTENAGCGNGSDVPVFIVGMPRSGTTLVEQILASHPKVFGGGEMADLALIFDSLGGGNRAPSGDELRLIGDRYMEKLRRKAPQAERITNKMPGNFFWAGLIHVALPNARVIHLRRDPIETCFSCYSRLFNFGHFYTYDLGELGRYYRAYEGLMDHWRSVLPESAMLDISYEELVADFEPQARRIVAYCGLEWDDACLSFHRTERPVTTASAFQVRQPLYDTSVERARPYEPWLGPLREALGGAP